MIAYQRTKRMKGLSREDQVWFGTWLLTGLALYALWPQLFAAFWIFVVPVYGLHLIVGTALLIWWGTRPFRDHWASFWPAGLVLAAGLGLIFGAGHLSLIGVWLKFITERPMYEAIIGRAVEGTLQGDLDYGWGVEGKEAGIEYRSDFGRPVRVAFVWSRGFDNWSGIVWDPTGVVASARGWRRVNGQIRSTVHPDAERLFGGGLVSCRALGGHYYSCGFS
jgi:hypothetical protein